MITQQENSDQASGDTGGTIKFDKELFLAEYNSLRQEILQRISQQTTIAEITITAWGVILAYALQEHKPDEAGKLLDNYNDIVLLLIYPLLAFFISFGWAFNNTRICQIGSYLRKQEKKFPGSLNWETFIYGGPNKKRKSSPSKINHGLAIFIGTQVATLLVVLITLITQHKNEFFDKPHPSWRDGYHLIIFLSIVAGAATVYTIWQISGSETVPEDSNPATSF